MGAIMSEWKQLLEPFLGSEEASASTLDAEARVRLSRILNQASASNETGALLQELDARFPARTADQLHLDRAYLRGRCLLALGREASALEVLLPVCEKLEQLDRMSDLAAVASDLLLETGHIDTARYLAKAAEQGGAEVIPEGSLQRAFELFPDEQRLAWLVAEQCERRGETDAALGIYIGCLPLLIDAREHERIEEVFMRLEDLSDVDTVLLMLHSCVKLATLKDWALTDTYLEPLIPKLRAAGLAREAWEQFMKLLPKAPPDTHLRRFLRDLAPEALADVDGVLELLARSGVLDPAIKAETAIKKLNELLEFAPGHRVLHHGFGAGRIRVNEGEALVIDFPGRPGHRMTIALARKSLQVIPADDLRVLWAEDANRVRQLAAERPAELAFLAIRELGGKATAQVLRRRLTDQIMPVARWSTWWKEARAAMEGDERFDLSESFRQTYGIRVPGAADPDDVLMPRLDRRRGIRANLNLLRRFLDQHPHQKDRAVRMYTPLLTRWLRDEHTNPEAAMAICLLLNRWGRLEREDLHRSLRDVLATGVEATAFADEADQRYIVEHAFEFEELVKPALLFALGSRYESARAQALAKMAENPGPSETLLQNLLGHPEERVQTAFAIIWMIITEGEKPAFLPAPWTAALALCRLVERTNRDVLRSQAMRLFVANSPLELALRPQPAADETLSAFEDTFSRWRASERFLFPILAFFDTLGMGELAAEIRAQRSEATNAFLRTPGAEAGHYDGFFLTRPTYTQLEQERDRLAWELKTTVAQAIGRAREMGDISENAEYDAAKDKQAKHVARIGAINDQLRKATLIGSIEVPVGQVGPGSWVTLRRIAGPGAETRTFWLLGEGDSRFGPEVVSSSAPTGRALLGRKVGEEVEIEFTEGRLRAQITATVVRLPEGEPAAGQAR
jgi:transcription elongation factor GreA